MPIISGGKIIEGALKLQPAFSGAGAPAANFAAGQCVQGDKYLNTTNGVEYVCTATNGSTTATWVITGAQV